MIILTKYRTNSGFFMCWWGKASLRICVCTMMNMNLVFYYKNLCHLFFFIFAKIVSFVLVMILDYHLICSCFCLLILCVCVCVWVSFRFVGWWSLSGVWDFALWERDWWGFAIEGSVEYVLFRLCWIIIFLHQNQGHVLDPHHLSFHGNIHLNPLLYVFIPSSTPLCSRSRRKQQANAE